VSVAVPTTTCTLVGVATDDTGRGGPLTWEASPVASAVVAAGGTDAEDAAPPARAMVATSAITATIAGVITKPDIRRPGVGLNTCRFSHTGNGLLQEAGPSDAPGRAG
jgi:hypothetical protein